MVSSDTGDRLRSWNDTAARRAIVGFVETVTSRDGPGYVPPEERVAVFDNDGTLWCEKPMPIELGFILQRLAGLSRREREVTRLVLHGRSTRETAGDLHVSAYTVQDHLKAIFAKVGVGSRRELVAQLFLQHSAPRLEGGATVGSDGWFADAGSAERPRPAAEPDLTAWTSQASTHERCSTRTTCTSTRRRSATSAATPRPSCCGGCWSWSPA
jgi:DNA-binding CsgD family transcriptional regulator